MPQGDHQASEVEEALIEAKNAVVTNEQPAIRLQPKRRCARFSIVCDSVEAFFRLASTNALASAGAEPATRCSAGEAAHAADWSHRLDRR